MQGCSQLARPALFVLCWFVVGGVWVTYMIQKKRLKNIALDMISVRVGLAPSKVPNLKSDVGTVLPYYQRFMYGIVFRGPRDTPHTFAQQ